MFILAQGKLLSPGPWAVVPKEALASASRTAVSGRTRTQTAGSVPKGQGPSVKTSILSQ